MSSDYAGVSSYHTTIPLPDDGEYARVASVNGALQYLADNAANLDSRMSSTEALDVAQGSAIASHDTSIGVIDSVLVTHGTRIADLETSQAAQDIVIADVPTHTTQISAINGRVSALEGARRRRAVINASVVTNLANWDFLVVDLDYLGAHSVGDITLTVNGGTAGAATRIYAKASGSSAYKCTIAADTGCTINGHPSMPLLIGYSTSPTGDNRYWYFDLVCVSTGVFDVTAYGS